MLQLWMDYGFYLWGLTTALVVVALAWLAYNSFAGQDEGEPEAPAGGADPAALAALDEKLNALAEATPHMQATLGRTLQYCGLVRYPDGSGAQAFTLAVCSARGDGFVLSSSVRGGLGAKALSGWSSNQPLGHEERTAIDKARDQLENG
jgi:hypothetical protein